MVSKQKYQKICVAGLLVCGEKVLVVRRSAAEQYLTGYYELPGGKVDFGNHPEVSLQREFMEEVNINILVKNIFRIFEYISHDGLRHTVELVYFVELADDKKNIKLSEEHDDYKWITSDDVDNIRMSDEIRKNVMLGLKQLKSERIK